MPGFISYIKAVGVYQRFTMEQHFHPGVNILHGKNGTGKTTLLHIIANLLNGDYRRFAFLEFDTIEAHLDDGTTIFLKKDDGEQESTISVEKDSSQIDQFLVKKERRALAFRPGVRSSTDTSMEDYEEAYRSLQSVLSTAYFPAFRTLIEASDDNETRYYYSDYPEPYLPRRYRMPEQYVMRTTVFARSFFGDFVPWINYPSPVEVARKLASEVQQARNNIAKTDQKLHAQAFIDIFTALSQAQDAGQDAERPDTILREINLLTQQLEHALVAEDVATSADIYSRLRQQVLSAHGLPAAYVPILEIYRTLLDKRATTLEMQNKTIKVYLDSVNQFLENKELSVKNTHALRPTVHVKFSDGSYSHIGALSSGERQIVTLLYAATHMSDQHILLIDEPELSLHIDWQEKLLPEMVQQMEDKQIITCTHSPMIGAKYGDRMMELRLSPTHQAGICAEEEEESAEAYEEVPF